MSLPALPRRFAACLLGALLLAPSAVPSLAAAPAPAGYHLITRFPIGGDGGYDYARVDPAARRLYVAHDTRVEVLDADTGKKIGEIAPTVHAHGIALAPEFRHGFITNGDNNTITMFDPATLRILKVIPSPGRKPDAIEYDPDTKHVFVADGASGDLAVLDAATGGVIADVPLGGHLEAMACNGYGLLWICAEDLSVLHTVNTYTLKPDGDIPLAPGEGPTGLALDPVARRLWVACGNGRLLAIDSDAGMVIADFPIGDDPDGAMFDPVGRRVFVSCKDGTLTIAQYKSNVAFGIAQVVRTQVGARTIALDAKTHRVFLPTAQFGPAPAPTAAQPHPQPPILPGTFEVLVVGP